MNHSLSSHEVSRPSLDSFPTPYDPSAEGDLLLERISVGPDPDAPVVRAAPQMPPDRITEPRFTAERFTTDAVLAEAAAQAGGAGGSTKTHGPRGLLADAPVLPSASDRQRAGVRIMAERGMHPVVTGEDNLRSWGVFVGHAMLSAFFLYGGLMKLLAFRQATEALAARAYPVPEAIIAVGAVIELAGSLALATGYALRKAAAVLIGYLVIVTLAFHNPVTAFEMNGHDQTVLLLQNMAIIGGLFVVLSSTNRRRHHG